MATDLSPFMTMSLLRSFTETVKSSVALLYTTSLVYNNFDQHVFCRSWHINVSYLTVFSWFIKLPDDSAELDVFLNVFLVPTSFQIIKKHLPTNNNNM